MKKTRLVELDSLRGIAALLVIFYHYFYRYNQIYGHEHLISKWSAYGHYGVQLFFLISGFVIYWTIIKVDRPLDFVVSRFSRLYPVYWCALLITFVTVSTFGLTDREVSSIEAFYNIFMFHEYLGIKHVDGVYWTLTVELTFYFWVFILALVKAQRKIEYFLLPFVFISILHYTDIVELPVFYVNLFILEYISFFISGICFYKLLNKINDSFTLPIIILCLLSTAFIYSYLKIFLFLIMFVLFYLAISGKLPFLRSKFLIYLGSISYPLYLIHQNIGYIIINAFYVQKLNVLVGIAVAIVINVILASLLVKFIEQPTLNFMRTIYKKIQQKN